MKALILTGGLGTRLRPFTLDTAKPLLPVANLPFIHYQLRHLRQHGVREVLLATAYRPEQFKRALGNGRSLGLKIRYIHEKKPLGTGGAVRNCARWLGDTSIVLNGDVLQSVDIGALRKQHRKEEAEATITLVRVEDPTRFGLVETEPDGRIRRFLEKPSPDEITCDTINAGAYIFEKSALLTMPAGKPYSLERGLFPKLLGQGRRLFGFVHEGYWLDFGTTEKYLQIHLDVLGGSAPGGRKAAKRRGALQLDPGARVDKSATHQGVGQVLIGKHSHVAADVLFGGSVSIGPDCRIAEGAQLENCVVLGGSTIGSAARLKNCIIGTKCRIGKNAAIGAGVALGSGSKIKDFSQLAGGHS
jgi:mannose-1-phosphate guanylyltransferase